MPPAHGRRLIPSTIDQIAEESPNRVWASVQLETGSNFEDIPFAVFANAINRVARWIVDAVGVSPASGEKSVLAYIGPSDLRYFVVPVAIIKAGYAPLFTSHLNSNAANSALFQATGCTRVLCGFDDPNSLSIDPQAVKIFGSPNNDEVWNKTAVQPFPFTKSFEEAYQEPLMILHTSGSTGMPKPITYLHGSFGAHDPRQDIPDHEGYESEPRMHTQVSRHFLGFPPFHPAGFASGMQDSIWFGVTIVVPRADRPLDAQAVIQAIDHGRIESAALLPHVLEDIARTPAALERLRKLRYIAWVGGPISQHAGDEISARTELHGAYASTEMGSSNQLIKKDRSLWNYFCFNPIANGFEFRPITGDDNVHELFIVRNPDVPQHVFRLFPHLDEWPTRDLFTPHPNLPYHWKLAGRSDSLIVLQNGSKVNPTSTEATVKRAPGVRDALMFGTSRTRPGILIEPDETAAVELSNDSGKSNFLDQVFPFVQISNQTAPENGVIVRELLVLATPDKPLPRSGKQTAQRGMALDLYKEEIDAAYEALPSNLQKMKDFRIGSELP